MSRNRSLATLVVLALLLSGCDWTMAGFDAANSGNNGTETGLTLATVTGLHAVWSAPGPSGGVARQIVAADHRIVVANGELDAFDPATGASVWAVPAGSTRSDTCPWGSGGATVVRKPNFLTVVGGSLYGEDAKYACDTIPPSGDVGEVRSMATGEYTDFQGGLVLGAVPGPDGTVYLDQFDSGLGGSDINGGSVFFNSLSVPLSVPAVSGTALYTADNEVLYRVSTSDGSTVWQNWLPGTDIPYSAPRPSTDGTRVYVASDTHVASYDAGTGAMGWDVTLPAALNTDGPTIGGGGLLYVESADHLYALDRATGGTVWSAVVPTASGTPNRPTVANGVVYVASGSHLLMFDAAGSVGCAASVCTSVATVTLADASAASPVVANGAVYVGSGAAVVKLAP